jgi:ribonuclease HI
MAKKKSKYYVVWKGHKAGIFESWDDCKAQIKDYKGAQYKSFTSFDTAKKALKEGPKDYIGKSKTFKSELSDDQLRKIGEPNFNSISWS